MPHCITAHHCTMLCPIYPISHNITTEQTIRSSQIESDLGQPTWSQHIGYFIGHDLTAKDLKDLKDLIPLGDHP